MIERTIRYKLPCSYCNETARFHFRNSWGVEVWGCEKHYKAKRPKKKHRSVRDFRINYYPNPPRKKRGTGERRDDAQFRECGFCGTPFMANNNSTGKVKIRLYHGRIICWRCATQVFGHPEVKKYTLVLKSLTKVGCLKTLAKKGKPGPPKDPNCTCAGCVTRELFLFQKMP